MIASPPVAPLAPIAPIGALAPVLPAWQPAVERAPSRRRPARNDSPLATIAHELRGPLHSLTASAELLAEDVDELSPEQIRDMARAIHRRALWLQGLTENLLCTASAERGGLSIHPELRDLREVVEEALLVVTPLLERRSQQVDLDLPDVPAHALVDGRRVGQALTNLVLNASKYSDPGSRVQVRLTPAQPGRWRITVSDEGPGLPHDDVAVLFEPYVRGTQTTDGLGIGLAVVKSIVAAHNGRVGAAPGAERGAEFWIEL